MGKVALEQWERKVDDNSLPELLDFGHLFGLDHFKPKVWTFLANSLRKRAKGSYFWALAVMKQLRYVVSASLQLVV